MNERRTLKRWEVAQLRASNFRAWAIVCLGLTFWLAATSLLSGSDFVGQLALSMFAGAVVGWVLAAVHSGRASALRRKSDKSGGEQ